MSGREPRQYDPAPGLVALGTRVELELVDRHGAVEALACIMSVVDDVIPPTINFHEGDEDEEIDYKLNFTFNKAQKRTVRAALSNTFGFGGHNASIIVKKFAK